MNAKQRQRTIVAKAREKCPICKKEPTLDRGLVKDHCHATGKQREEICHNCNIMLGMARDNPWVLRRGANYLQRHKTKDLPINSNNATIQCIT